MSSLKCDICGGNLSMDAGGKTASCVSCGMKHSIERIREMVGVTECAKDEKIMAKDHSKTNNDVEQQKALLKKYMSSFDYQSAKQLVNKILEDCPKDSEVLRVYDSLNELQYFEIKNGVLSKYNGNKIDIIIPDGITEIGAEAFKRNDTIESVVISDSVKRIGYAAFYLCRNLKNAIIGKGVDIVGDSAFGESGITKIVIPGTVKYVGIKSFSRCTSLKKVTIENGVEVIGESAFETTAISKIIIPGTVKVIQPHIFCGCSSLTELKLEYGIKYIQGITCGIDLGHSNFYGVGITSLHIPGSVKSIGAFSFYGCHSLKDVIIDDGVEDICEQAFGKTKITNVTIPDSVKNIECGAFDCDDLEKVVWKKLTNVKLEAHIDDKFEVVLKNNEIFKPFFGSKYYKIMYDSVVEPLKDQAKKQKEKAYRRHHCFCQHCGGSFIEKGVFKKRLVCRDCGIEKDY